MLAKRISRWRAARGLSRADLADACEVTVSAVGLWERGDGEPSFRSLVQLVDALGLSLAQFFGELPSNDRGGQQ